MDPNEGFPSLSDDLLIGAEAIARFVFGDDPRGPRRVFQHSTEVRSAAHRLPVFKLGDGTLAARKSSILAKITELEQADRTARDDK